MKYDFTTEINRHGKDAMAVDGLGLIPGKAPNPPKEGFDVIPMWIADMSCNQKNIIMPLFIGTNFIIKSKD